MALVDYRATDGVAWLTLDAPPANTYSYEMMQELDRAVLEARMDDDVHVLVLSGAGEKFFCAGADIAMLQQAEDRIKRAVCSGLDMSMSEGLALERELQQQLFASSDAREGIAAHVEKRKAEFKGK